MSSDNTGCSSGEIRSHYANNDCESYAIIAKLVLHLEKVKRNNARSDLTAAFGASPVFRHLSPFEAAASTQDQPRARFNDPPEVHYAAFHCTIARASLLIA
jgi:hypothetical protein